GHLNVTGDKRRGAVRAEDELGIETMAAKDAHVLGYQGGDLSETGRAVGDADVLDTRRGRSRAGLLGAAAGRKQASQDQAQRQRPGCRPVGTGVRSHRRVPPLSRAEPTPCRPIPTHTYQRITRSLLLPATLLPLLSAGPRCSCGGSGLSTTRAACTSSRVATQPKPRRMFSRAGACRSSP